MTEPVQSATPSVADVLNYAANLVAEPGGWMQGGFANNAKGLGVDAADAEATCFCAVGAVIAARARLEAHNLDTTTDLVFYARRVAQPGVADHLLDPLSEWNDNPGRTQDEVVALLRKAAEAAQ